MVLTTHLFSIFREWDSSSCTCRCRSPPLSCAPGLHWDADNCLCAVLQVMLVVFTIKLATNVMMVVIFILTMLLDRQSKRPAAWALMVKEGRRVPSLLSTFIRWPQFTINNQSLPLAISTRILSYCSTHSRFLQPDLDVPSFRGSWIFASTFFFKLFYMFILHMVCRA